MPKWKNVFRKFVRNLKAAVKIAGLILRLDRLVNAVMEEDGWIRTSMEAIWENLPET